MWWSSQPVDNGATSPPASRLTTAGGLAILPQSPSPGLTAALTTIADRSAVQLRVEMARLKLLRGFEELLCLHGLRGVEHLPHQIETVRKVLRYFHGRVLLADEVGLGKTIEACLLIREYVLRGYVSRVLILVPAGLVMQWREELESKFDLKFSVANSKWTADDWATHPRVLASISMAKSRSHFAAVGAHAWDLVAVDEAHHCKNRGTLNWKLVNSLQRRHMFLLTATPVQNDLIELYNLLTLLEPGHLKTEKDFKKTFVTRGNPRDPRNRNRLRELLGLVMVRNTRGLVNVHLPRRYAQTFIVQPEGHEAALYRLLETYLRWRCGAPAAEKSKLLEGAAPARGEVSNPEEAPAENAAQDAPAPDATAREATADVSGIVDDAADFAEEAASENAAAAGLPDAAALAVLENIDKQPAQKCSALARRQLQSLLLAAGSHPLALRPALERLATEDVRAAPLAQLACNIGHTAKESKLLELLQKSRRDKVLVFANFINTLHRLEFLLRKEGYDPVVLTGSQSMLDKQFAIDQFKAEASIMLCSDSGGEGFNLQFANTLINFDLPWNPMRIEQRIGRVHRIGQTREVFIFNLCTAGSLEERIVNVLGEKLRLFELVVGEVGSILGNLEHGEEFESLVLNLWMRSRNSGDLDDAFDRLGGELLEAQEQYLKSKELDEALFGDDFE